MPESGWVDWLQSRGFYALLVLALVGLGLLVARTGKRRSDPRKHRTRAEPHRARPKPRQHGR